MIIISKVKMLITVFVRILTVGQGYFIPAIYSKYNQKYEMQGKIQKFQPHIERCAVGGDYSQNVPKPKCTQVKMYLSGVKIYSSEVKT